MARAKFETKRREFLKADGTTKVKLDFPIYGEQEELELLLKLIRSYNKAVMRYDLCTILGADEVYDRFQQCLGGDAFDMWEAIATTQNQTNWEPNINELIELLIGEDAYEEQRDYYLEDIKKPHEMKTRTWILQMKVINTYLPALEGGVLELP